MTIKTIPVEANEEILDFIINQFQRQTRADLSLHRTQLEPLLKEAEVVRQALEYKDEVEIDFCRIFNGQMDNPLIGRQLVQSWYELIKKKNPFTDNPPVQCLDCNYTLMGNWECPSCGLELESPTRLNIWRQSSTEVIHHLPRGYFLIPDPIGKRLFFINRRQFNHIAWQINQELIELKEPWSALLLNNKKHILVTDRLGGRVIEISRLGTVKWELDTHLSPEYKLNQPVKASLYLSEEEQERFLIVDQGHHRVFACTRDHKFLWQYGKTGTPGSSKGYLNCPNDAQKTAQDTLLITDTGNNRVIEILENGHILWTIGKHQKLQTPLFARRLWNGNTMVVDAGNYRILEFDSERNLKYECKYFKEGMDSSMIMTEPIGFIRRENQNVLLFDTDKILEIMPAQKQLVWFAKIKDLVFEGQTTVPLKKPYETKSFDEYSLPKRDKLPEPIEVLKQVKIFAGAPENLYKKLEQHLKPVVYYKDDLIIKQGEKGNSLFLIYKGEVEVFFDGQKSIIATLSSGDIFGEMALVLSQLRSANVKAVGYCELFRLDKWVFERIVRKFPKVYEKVKAVSQERAKVSAPPMSAEANARLQELMAKRKASLKSPNDQT